ncbi:MAG TPA: hypothetical protein VFR95_14475, partial [Gemmatimonadaceae bacterium]|nr:hypothetical protein [Gemmatimonadaceae bacterium]
TRLSHAYGVGLATIGLFTTVQFVMHIVMQIPGGRAADRWGARTSAFVGRAVVGVGTGFAFVGGSDYIRASGGTPFLQGIYGGASVLSPGIALALVPGFASWTGFRAPYWSALAVVALCALALAAAPSESEIVSATPKSLFI